MASKNSQTLPQSWPKIVIDQHRSLAELISNHDWSWTSVFTSTVEGTKALVNYQVFLLCKIVFDDWKLPLPTSPDATPRFKISPSSTVDEVWHAHMLNPMNYAAFCQKTLQHWFEVNSQTQSKTNNGELLLIDHSPALAADNNEIKLRRQLKRMDCINEILVSRTTNIQGGSVLLPHYRQSLVEEEIQLHRLLVQELEPIEINIEITKDETTGRGVGHCDGDVSQGNNSLPITINTPSNKPITLHFKTLTGKRFRLNDIIPQETTILRLKELIQVKEGMPPDMSLLIYRGRRMEDNYLVSDYNISEESLIDLIANLRGC